VSDQRCTAARAPETYGTRQAPCTTRYDLFDTAAPAVVSWFFVRRRKRLRKKVHALYLADMRLDISLSSAWRERLFASPTGTVFRVHEYEVRSPVLRCAIRRFDLRYAAQAVHPQPLARTTDNRLVCFTFSSLEFPAIRRSSWNNPSCVTPCSIT
jgi:hypothetical protein